MELIFFPFDLHLIFFFQLTPVLIRVSKDQTEYSNNFILLLSHVNVPKYEDI
jgi:hypothetical protein